MSGPEPLERLAGQRATLAEQLARLEHDLTELFAASRDTNADDEHDPEGQTIGYERAQLSAMVRQARAHLVEVDAATARVAAGTYGVCEVCGHPIAPERLEAKPTARTCVADAER